MSAITLYIVEDHPVVREGLRMLVQSAGDVHVTGAAASASSAIGELRRIGAPDVLLLDLDLGTEDGLAWLPRIQHTVPSTRVLILTALRDQGRDAAALRAGARGFLHKDAPADVVMRAVRTVAAGELWFRPEVMRVVPATPARQPRPSGLGSLTSRERAIVDLVVEGLRNVEIARRLGITEKTVRNHLTAVFAKVEVSSRLELVVLAHRQGMIRRPR